MTLINILTHPVALLLIAVAAGLLLAIIILGFTVISAMDIFREKMKKATMIALLLTMAGIAHGQEVNEPIATATSMVAGLPDTSFYLLVSVITLELLVILFLLQALRVLTGIVRSPRPKRERKKRTIHWFEKLNKTRSLDADSEAAADMGHDYDGIRELNNPTPPWWRWGFYFSIFFGVIYLWRYHVSHAAPLQLEELAIAEQKAAEAKAAYLKNADNNIDENNVKLITDAGELATAKKIFTANCAACHGPEGQGLVGPNLTDDYWLHGGTLKEIFTTIKYGVPDKGMKSWKEDLSPKQLALLCSYIKSIHGSHPVNPKEKQGELYEGE
ncbi:c-type cytochrome [Chitinophaga pendula]|uniref:cbb3-type cytochrome c oxidase N-terminal domain-containing protein n=1 Tax=Chitinophaga TaxID=79328 RepID=UPI000BB02D94|nr:MULTISPECIES: cbb3-type cytochrome c oxidase N-terminal domain-containing protein [Chitinophaga]ASZ14365.1 hypothetical protein CK934_27175 [Chitinophaga sp. MD30]UCJ07985.1 c-type cytochrome [Chitinophaga pendula]